MRRPFQRLTSPTLARRQAPLCSLADLANAHTSSSPEGANHSIQTQRRILDFACMSSHKEDAAQMFSLQDG
jgi:hypothetical protein